MALMAGTTLIFVNTEPKKFEKLLLDEGDFLVFNRGFIHRGSSYEKENRRMHA